MRRPRSGIGAELVPLVLILACLAGSLALIVMVHRRAPRAKPASPPLAVALPPARVDQPVAAPAPLVVDEPDPPPAPAPPPEDPTPRVVARLTSAEAEQLLEASRADRKAAALETARKAALEEAERWRRREALARLQLDTVDAKVRKFETQVDELALERDALEKERDARKALAAQARSRPGQAILPHRGQNGTWRRPIVVECTNGMAILRPQGVGFGLLELASGFGPVSNPFIAAVAREVVRVQGSHSPDGQPVTPYIFFLVRPDGIRPYYEARGRLEPMGITFGYELADQDWEVDFPDLDDVKTWDGSGPSRPEGLDPLASSNPTRQPGRSPAESEDFPSWGSTPRGNPGGRDETSRGEFTWPSRSRGLQGGAASPERDPLANLRELAGSAPPGTGIGTGGGRTIGPIPDTRPRPPGLPADVDPLGRFSGTSTRPARPGAPLGGKPDAVEPRELALGSGPIQPLSPSPSTDSAGKQAEPAPTGSPDPADSFVWNAKPGEKARNPAPGDPSRSPDQSPAVRHVGPFSRPLAMGVEPGNPSSTPSGGGDPSQVGDSTSSGSASRSFQANASGGSPSPNANPAPPPGSIGVALPGSGPGGSGSGSSPSPSRGFEIVVVCGPRGVIVQPGGYRVTADALKDRDDLMKKQLVALVRAKRAAEPQVVIEPRVRFLIQAGGEKNYWTARSQFLISGLEWPISVQVADPDHVSLMPSEGW